MREQLKVAHHEGNTIDLLTRLITDLKNDLPTRREPPAWVTQQMAKGSSGTPVAMLSDIHYGKIS